MISRWRWLLRQVGRRLWVRAALIGFLGVFTAVLAAVVERFIPWDLPSNIGVESVDNILNIIASSMLAVTTFSLSVMLSAYGAAANNVTPRATQLLVQDRVTQNVLSTFIGSFLFSLVGIIVLQTGAYGERGRVVLFAVTIGVIALIVLALLRWIDHLSKFGRVGETTDRVEKATVEAMEERLNEPFLGGVPLRDGEEVPAEAFAVCLDTAGYVQHLDVGALASCAEDLDAEIYVGALPGTFVHPSRPLAWVVGKEPENEDVARAVRECFSVGAERGFDQDPRFGLAVMTEIASRALSPATKDSGTAIDVIGRILRLMVLWGEGVLERPEKEVRYPNVHVPPLLTEDLFDDAFMLIARDGAGLIEVQLRLQKAFAALAQVGDGEFRACARRYSQVALARAESAMTFEGDKEALRELVRRELAE